MKTENARFHGVEGGVASKSGAGLRCQHFIKDMGIALAEAEKMNICLPGLALAKQLYMAVRAQGYGRKGTQALLLALEHLNNVKR
jgi:3-hydroxyisobutyrate dehydrogenase